MTYADDREAVLDILANADAPLTATDIVWRGEHPADDRSYCFMQVEPVLGLLAGLYVEGVVSRAGDFEGQPMWALKRG